MLQEKLAQFFKSKLTGREEDKKSIWRSVAESAPLILIVSLVTLIIHNLGFLQSFETTTVDTLVKLNPVVAKHVFIVGITNSDYENLFSAQSPLNYKKVEKVIDAIATGEPKVIVVDLDTATEEFRNLKLPPPPVKVVFSREARLPAANDDFSFDQSSAAQSKDVDVFVPQNVLGKSKVDANLWGIAILPEDADSIVRHYYRYVLIKDPNGAKSPVLAPTIPWAAVQAFRGEQKLDTTQANREMILSLSGGEKYLPHISAGDLLSIFDQPGWKDTVKDKVVLLGGFYNAARDSYVTPIGQMAGVELQAEAIESELQRGGIHQANPILLILAQVLASILVVVINCRFAGTWVPVAGFVLIPAIAFVASLVCFSSMYLWADFVPVLFAVQLHYQLIDMKHVRQKMLALEHANKQLARAKVESAEIAGTNGEQESKHGAHALAGSTLGHLAQLSFAQAIDTTGGAASVIEAGQKAVEHLARVIKNRYPAVLKVGFHAALQKLANNETNRSFTIELIDSSGKLADCFNKDVQLSLYRIIEEALENAREQAGATKAQIAISANNGDLIISVIYNGIRTAKSADGKDSYGLQGVKIEAVIGGAGQSPPPGFAGGSELRLTMPAPALNKNLT